MSKTRIYAVTRNTAVAGKPATRLVRASQAGPALTFVAKGEYTVEVASQDDLVAAFKAGVEVENEPVADPKAGVQVDVEDVTGAVSQTQTPPDNAIL